jgi:hypothetical protein
MQALRVVNERVPMVWFLLGLLLNATGLYLGFEFVQAFFYMIVGWFCCAFGIALQVFRRREQPRSAEKTRLSPKFISAGATQVMQAMSAEALAAASSEENGS